MSETETMNKISSLVPDWSKLPEELFHLISTKLENHCFDIIHARSVSRLWRSTFPFPCSLLRPSYSLPDFPEYPDKTKDDDFYTLKKVPYFLFRVRAPREAAEYFLGGMGLDESSNDHMELPFPLQQCSVKANTLGSEPILMKMLDCQIFPLGHQYRMINSVSAYTGDVALLPLEKKGKGGEFVVLVNRSNALMVLTSVEMKWKKLFDFPTGSLGNIVTFRGKFYVVFDGGIVCIDPCSLEVTQTHLKHINSYLVPYGNDELFLVELIFRRNASQFTCRVSRLDDKANKWVEVRDLGDRVLFVRGMGNVSWLAKDLPHGCGFSGNSILFINMAGNVPFPYKYGVRTENVEDNLNCWRSSMENRVIINRYRQVTTLHVER